MDNEFFENLLRSSGVDPLVYYANKGMTQEEVAEELGMKKSTVQSIEQTAMRKVKYIVKELGLKKEDLI